MSALARIPTSDIAAIPPKPASWTVATKLAEEPNEVAPSDRLLVVNALMCYQQGLPIAAKILADLMKSDSLSKREFGLAANQPILCLIGSGQFDEAKNEISWEDTWPKEADICDVFNHAMCIWGKTGNIPQEELQRVLEMARQKEDKNRGAKFAQCLALVHACLKESVKANEYAEQAIELIGMAAEIQFSCWRYRNVLPKEFIADCKLIVRFADVGEPSPVFLQPTIQRHRTDERQRYDRREIRLHRLRPADVLRRQRNGDFCLG